MDQLDREQMAVLEELRGHSRGCDTCRDKPGEIPFYGGCPVFTELVDRANGLERRSEAIAARALGTSDGGP